MKVKNEYTYSACKTNWLRAIHGKIFRSGPKVFEMFNFCLINVICPMLPPLPLCYKKIKRSANGNA